MRLAVGIRRVGALKTDPHTPTPTDPAPLDALAGCNTCAWHRWPGVGLLTIESTPVGGAVKG